MTPTEPPWNPWRDVEAAQALERARQFWAQPWAYERPADDWCDGRPLPARFPPGYRGVTSTCGGCPYATCADCPCRNAWDAFLNPTTPPRPSLWRRMIARLREENTNT